MATLEKIRSKSVFLLVIIGLALLAFIIGDVITNGRNLFGTGTTLAEVDGHKVDIVEFQNRLEDANRQVQQSGRKVDNAVLQQQVLDQLIAEKLYKAEVEKLGLTVTDKELTEAMVGSGSAMLDRMVASQTGINSARELYDMANNPSKYGLDEQQAAQLRSYWNDLEKQVEETLVQQKFQTLFTGTLVANNLDAKALYDDNNASSRIVFAKQEYSTVPDEEVGEPTEQEIDARYQQERNRFRLDEQMRRVSYINVPLVPSSEDRAAAQQRVNKAVEALTSLPETVGIAEMTEFVTNRQRSAAGRISDARLKSFLTEARDSAVRVISSVGDSWKIAKLIGRSSEVDSVSIDFIMLAGDKAAVDSMIASLNAGTPFEAAAANPAVQGSQKAQWISLVDPQMTQIRETILSAPAGTYFTPDTAATLGGARILRINERKAPVTIYDYAVVDYTVEPSNATINKAMTDLDKFLAENKTATAFAENAEKAGYMLQNANVTASTPQLGNIPDSRAAISWAMKAKKGQVSPIIGGIQSGSLIAEALDDIYKGDYAPVSDPNIRDIVSREVLNDKKGAKLVADYNGKAKDVAGYATLMKTTPDTATVIFAQAFIPKVGYNESAIAAAAATAKPGTLVGPMAGAQKVIVFQVIDRPAEGRPYDFDESSAQFMRSRGASPLGQKLNVILRGNKKVKNNMLKFYNDSRD